jgi:rhamnosyltransferase
VLWEQRPYDEQLTGLEDLDWAKYAMESGYWVAYVAEAPIVHVHDESFGQVLNRYRREAIAHKEIYNDQEMSIGMAVRLAAINMLGDYREAMRAGSLHQNLIDVVRFRTAQFLGTYRGFTQSGPVTDVLKRRFYYPTTEGPITTEPRASDIGQRIDYGESVP